MKKIIISVILLFILVLNVYGQTPVEAIVCTTDECCQENFDWYYKYDSIKDECIVAPSQNLINIKEKFEDEYGCEIINIESSKLFLLLNEECNQFSTAIFNLNDYFFMEFRGVPNFCTNWYLNPNADFLDASDQDLWTITETIKHNKNIFVVKDSQFRDGSVTIGFADGYYWCENPNLMGYASSEELLDKYFIKTECIIGETKYIECNFCQCTEIGQWACTLEACPLCDGEWIEGECISTECTTNSDCPQNTCFGMRCFNGKCQQLAGMPAPPHCFGESWYGEKSEWIGYPDCKWVCKGNILCDWTTWAPEWGDNQCLTAYGIILGIIIILYLLFKKK